MSFWMGWVAYAGIVMLILGSFQVIEGTLALLDDEFFAVTRSGLAVPVSYAVWGWVHVLGGGLILVTGVAVFAGQAWARAVGVCLAAMNAVVNLGFMAADPVWTVIAIGMDILVIWALTVHGGEIRSDQAPSSPQRQRSRQ